MGDYEVMERTLFGMLAVLNPTIEDREICDQDINDLRTMISSVRNLAGAIVEPCGSFLSNLFARGEDVNISVELLNGSYICYRSKKCKQTLLEELLGYLFQNGCWRDLEFIHRKGFPAIKCQSNRSNISYEISIDNLQEIMKSGFLFRMNEIDGRFRDMVLLVKEWCEACRIDNPRKGALNSYSVILLVIFHFQTCEPPIFPPISEFYTGHLGFDLRGERDEVVGSISEEFDIAIAKFISNGHRRVNKSSLSELLISFFEKYSDLSAMVSDVGISTYDGQWEDIGCNPAWSPKNYAILIEDPFERPENAARCIIPSRFEQISEAFQRTYYELVAAQQSQALVLRALATKDTAFSVMQYNENIQYSHVSTRTPSINHNYTGVSQDQNALARTVPVIWHESRHAGKMTITNSSYNESVSRSSWQFRTRPLQPGSSSTQQSLGQGKGKGDKAKGHPENASTSRVHESSSRGQIKQVWRPKDYKGKQVI